MPGRVSTRATRESKPRSKSDHATPTDEIPAEGPSTALRQNVCAIFADAQLSNTGHRKLIIALRKIQEWCCYEPATGRSSAGHEDYDENDFNAEICRCMLRVFGTRKGEPAGDRVVKFMGAYLRHAAELDNHIFQEDDPEGAQALPETPSSRLASQIISLILPLLQAKDKVIRFRCTQIVSHLINTLDSIDDELFDHIRLGLLTRLRDKESSIRVQAVCGLGRLAAESDGPQDPDDSDDETSGGTIERLLDVLQNDPSGDVRRSLLMNLPFTSTTLPFLLERARDLDSTLRRALYSRLLPALGDFRHLSLTHREKLLRWGLRDRDDIVRKATTRLFRERWIEYCARSRMENGEETEIPPGQMSAPSSEGLMELLERIDVVNAGNDGGIAVHAMKEFWQGRPDYAEIMVFDEAYWKELSPESVFMARTFTDYCCLADVPDSLRDKLPEVTRLAYLIQVNINSLAASIRLIAVQEDAEEDSAHQEFVVEQLLHMALTLDYSDEVGRRTMFSIMREGLASLELPEECTRLVIEVLRLSCGVSRSAERDFCGVVLEAIAEVHDVIMGDVDTPKEDLVDESFHSARSELSGDSTPTRPQEKPMDGEKAIREIMVNMKCLHIAQCMLQNVECRLDDNAHLVTMLNNLVVPAVRSQEAPIRERGLLCLGLCCVLDKNLAEENLTLFLHCFTKGHEQLQTIAIQIIGDILATHSTLLVRSAPADKENGALTEKEQSLHKAIHKLFAKSLKSPVVAVQSTACAALCKLMLSAPSTAASRSDTSQSILDMQELLRLLVTAYFDPETSLNSALRQSLSYFIPVYCHSRKENMQCMGNVVLPVLTWFSSLKDEMDVDGEDDVEGAMVSINVVISHLVDWTDGRKLALARSRIVNAENGLDAETDVHVELAETFLEKTLGSSSRQDRKLYITLLGKLFISTYPSSTHPMAEHSPSATRSAPAPSQSRLQNVADLLREAIDDKIATDTTTRNTLLKLQNTVHKCLTEAPEVGAPPSPGTSRVASPAPLTEKNDADITQELSMLQLQSTTTTPVASPRKRGSHTTTDVKLDLSTLNLQSTSTTPANSPRKKSRAKSGAECPRGEEGKDEKSTASPVKRNLHRTTNTVHNRNVVEDVEGGQAEPSQAEPVIKVEEQPSPVKKPRGRPPKALFPGAPAVRKSVRAGRRKATVDEKHQTEDGVGPSL